MAATNTATITLNAAFLQEIKEVNEELWRLLEDVRTICRDRVALQGSARQLAEQMPELRDQLAMYFALEEAYGYFENPVEAAPHLSERAAALKHEHRELYVNACRLAEVAESLALREEPSTSSLARVAHLFEILDQRLEEHESAENELILAVYDDDLGVGD